MKVERQESYWMCLIGLKTMKLTLQNHLPVKGEISGFVCSPLLFASLHALHLLMGGNFSVVCLFYHPEKNMGLLVV